MPIILPPKAKEDDLHAWHLYVIRLTDDVRISRETFIEQMFQKGIGCSVHFIPLHFQPYWRDTYQLQPEDYPNALANYKRAVSLPLYTKMTEEDQERVIKAVYDIISSSII